MDINQLMESNDADRFTFGRYIRERRGMLQKTVRGFAKELDITASYLSDIEKGNRYAPKGKLEQIFRLLRIPGDQYQAFMDMASLTRGEYEDINPYLCRQYFARVALRKAERKNLSDKSWKKIIQMMDDDSLDS